MENSSDVKFIDADAYQGGQQEKTTFREIVLQHFKRIANFNCVEFRGGYWQDKLVGNFTEHFYVPDTREQYNGGVEYLHDLLLPYFDEEMQEVSKKIYLELDKKHEEYREKVAKDKENWESYEQKFLIQKLEFMRQLLQELSKLLFRLKYLEGRIFEEEA